LQLACNLETSLHVAHFDRSSGNTGVTLAIVRLQVYVQVLELFRGVDVGLFVKLLSLCGVALVFNLTGKLFADELLLIRGNFLG